MNKEQQYWEDTQEALSRIFDRCEEIDPQSGYDMLEDIQFIRGFINKHKPRTEEQETILDKIRAEIEEEYGYCNICEYFEDYDYEDNDISEYRYVASVKDILQIIDKYKAESEAQDADSN